MVSFDISVSLDGFIAGPNDRPGNGLGDGGEALHEWVYGLRSWREPHGLEGGEDQGRDDEVMAEAFAGTGAIVIGRRMFDLAEEAWGDDPPFHMPVFVVTHRDREREEKQGGTSYTFVTDGVEATLEQAGAAAGDGSIAIGGGADVIQQCLRAGAVDEFQLHLVPIFLRDGVRLFEDVDVALQCIRMIDSPAGVTHLKYRVVK